MFANSDELLKYVRDEGVEMVDVRFCDLPGVMQHFTVPVSSFDQAVFDDGLNFDGSSIRGFQAIHESDMSLFPDPTTAYIDPFRTAKTLVVNASHMRRLTVEDMAARMLPYRHAAELVEDPPAEQQQELLRAAVPLVHERIGKLTEAVDMLGFLFVDEAQFTRDPGDVEKLLDEDGRGVVKAAHDALAALDAWTTEAIDAALRQALVEELGLKPRHAFGPVRVAVTGSRVSPPLFESLELLGRERSLARLSSAQAG